MSTAIALQDPQVLNPSQASVRRRFAYPKGFPIKVRRFITEYARTGNATTAAISAGYSKASAHKTGWRLAKTDAVKAAIDAQLQQFAAESGLTVEYVLSRFKRIADDPETRNADKVAALSMIGKHLQMFTERREVDAKITITVERIGS
jgi:phage terminase small subunit